MKPASSNPGRSGQVPAGKSGETEEASRTSPDTDMQPEDAGSTASGNTGRGTAAENAMKQTSKPGNETDSRR